MKRIIALALTLMMVLSLAACGGKSDSTPSDSASSDASSSAADVKAVSVRPRCRVLLHRCGCR